MWHNKGHWNVTHVYCDNKWLIAECENSRETLWRDVTSLFKIYRRRRVTRDRKTRRQSCLQMRFSAMKHLRFIHLQRGFIFLDHQKQTYMTQKCFSSQINDTELAKTGLFFCHFDCFLARPSGAVSQRSEETMMSLGQLEPYHLLWMWLMCRFRCRGPAVHSAGLGFLLLLLLHFFPPSQKANRHIITQHCAQLGHPLGSTWQARPTVWLSQRLSSSTHATHRKWRSC